MKLSTMGLLCGLALLVGGCSIPRQESQPHVTGRPFEPLSADAVYLARMCNQHLTARESARAMIERSCQTQTKETPTEYLARMCEDTAEDVTKYGEGDFSWEEWQCEQLNPELGRKLKAEHDKYLADHPIQPYYYAGHGSGYYAGFEDGRSSAAPKAPDIFEEAEKAQQQIYHDRAIRSDQEDLDYAFHPW
jgi:hypothetical protein